MLTLAPVLLALLVTCFVTGPMLLHLNAQPLVWLAFWVVLLFGAWLEALPAPTDSAYHAARAFLVLALAVALGSEVLP